MPVGFTALLSVAAGVELSVLFPAALRSRDLLAFLPGRDRDRDVPVVVAAAGAPGAMVIYVSYVAIKLSVSCDDLPYFSRAFL